MQRSDAIGTVMAAVTERHLVVCGLGSPVSDVAGTRDRDLNFYLLGAMGMAAGVGLGLALAQAERPVLVVTGDAEIMMNVGTLATIGVRAPRNLTILVFDNERFGETGDQRSHTAHGVDIAAIATASGVPGETIRDRHGVARLAGTLSEMAGPRLAVLKVASGRVPIVMPPKSGVDLKSRFRRALLGTY